MPIQQWTWFYKWLSKDDYITQPSSYLYWKDIDASIFGYWATISRKSHKQILTNHPIYDIWGSITSNNPASTLMVWHDWVNGYIYDFASLDMVPKLTATPEDTDYNLLVWAMPNDGFHFIWRENVADSDKHTLHTAANAALLINWDNIPFDQDREEEGYILPQTVVINNDYIPAYLVHKNLSMVAWRRQIATLPPDTGNPITRRTIFSDDVTGIEELWTQIVVYTEDNKVSTWNGVAESVSSVKDLWYTIVRSWSHADLTYGMTLHGSCVQWNGFSFAPITDVRESLKADDNSDYNKLLDLWVEQGDRERWRSIDAIDSSVFFIEWGKRIAKLRSVRVDTPKWFHIVTTKTHTWQEIDKIYCIRAIRWKLYFSYKAWDTYWVDYIDEKSLESNTEWTLITPVFRGVPDAQNKLQKWYVTVSNTSWNKSVEIYQRKNWAEWVLAKIINEPTDKITRKDMQSKDVMWADFVDVQYKAILRNPDQDNKPPILHGISINYKVIQQ